MNGNQHGREDGVDDAGSDDRTFWNTVGALYRHWRLITAATFTVAVLSVVISLLLPDWYRASTRLLPPESGGPSNIAAMMGGSSNEQLGSIASSLLGGGAGGNYTRFMSLLTSETVMEAVVDSFDLTRVYETTESRAPVGDAISELRGNVSFVIDDEYEHLSIRVYDRDPQRAADMANFFARHLNERHTELSSQNAATYRRFIEERYRDVEAALDSARLAKQEFEEQHGVIQLPDQARQFLTSLAELRTETIQNEIRLEALRTQYGPNNTQVNLQEQLVEAARRQHEQMMGGSDVLLPVAYQNLPSLSRRYAEIMQEVTIQERILEYVRPLYEEARFDEQREKTAVQIVDPARPPVEAAWPVRSLICILATVSGFLLIIFGVVVWERMQANRSYLIRRLQETVSANGPRERTQTS